MGEQPGRGILKWRCTHHSRILSFQLTTKEPNFDLLTPNKLQRALNALLHD